MTTKNGVPVLTAEQAEQVTANLPPAGHNREEELKKRIDDLEQQLESLQNQEQTHRLDPRVFQEDREILKHMNELEVTDKQPGRVYKWVYYGLNGQMVMKMKYFGWRVIQSGDPECPEMKESDGTRRIGDTLLMWTTEEKYDEIEKRSERLRLEQQLGVEAALRELGERHRKDGLIVRTNLEDIPSRKAGHTMMDTIKERAARTQNVSKVTDMLKEGSVPGMPSPQK
jgi:hypothetical protein